MKQVPHLALLFLSVFAAFTPVTFRSAGLAATAAVCPTCCEQTGSTCIICGTEECVTHRNYYEGKVGPGGCSVTQT